MSTTVRPTKKIVPSGEIRITFDLESIPECVCNDLAAATIKAARTFFEKPGVEEKYQSWLAAKKAAAAAIQGGELSE